MSSCLTSNKASSAHRHRGFTLLEMAIVLVVIGTIIAGTISMGSSMIQSAQIVSTRNKLDAIETALMAYRTNNNRLPCPTDATLTDIAANAATFGYDAGHVTPNSPVGGCSGGSPAANFSYTVPNNSTNYAALGITVAEGALPVRTLGLPDEFQFDGWGRKFAYAVATPMTTAATGAGMAGHDAAFVSYGAQANCGAITVENAAHGNRTTVADYVLLSFGPDGHGGYNKAGTRYNAGVSNADELTNAHYSSLGVDTGYAATYVQKDISLDGSDAVNPFQHLVRFKERWQMQNAYDGYHPGSQLPCTTGFVVNGVSAGGDQAGYSLATGDINGDGIADIVIGAPYANSINGAVYVVFGTRKGFPDPLPLSSLNGSNGFELDGPLASLTGWSVATGDVNGDGIADVVIAAYSGNASRGYTYVVFGKTGSWTSPQTLNIGAGNLIDGTKGVRFDGVLFAGYSGVSVATGDVNGDGYADVVIGAYGANSSAGYTYLVFGKSATWGAAGNKLLNIGAGNLIDGTQGVRFDGVTASDNVGGALATGDINGDGYADVVIGAAQANSSAGYTYLVFGKIATWGAAGNKVLNIGAGNLIDGTQGVRFDGVTANDRTGTFLATGNINGDGIADLVIGAYNANSSAGYTYLVFGKETSWGAPGGNIVLNIGAGKLIDGTRGVRFDGVTAGDWSGLPVATGDINGDGIADLIIGTSGANSGAGYTYVVFGKSATWGAAGNKVLNTLTDGVQGSRFDGVLANDFSGYAVATGDVNGDGIKDIVIGAYNAPNGNADGSVYIYNGRNSGWPNPNFSLGGL